MNNNPVPDKRMGHAGQGADIAFPANVDAVTDDGVCGNARAASYLSLGANHRAWFDDHVRLQLGRWVDGRTTWIAGRPAPSGFRIE